MLIFLSFDVNARFWLQPIWVNILVLNQPGREKKASLTRPPYWSFGAGRMRPWTSVIVLLTLMPNVFKYGSLLKSALRTWVHSNHNQIDDHHVKLTAPMPAEAKTDINWQSALSSFQTWHWRSECSFHIWLYSKLHYISIKCILWNMKRRISICLRINSFWIT